MVRLFTFLIYSGEVLADYDDFGAVGERRQALPSSQTSLGRVSRNSGIQRYQTCFYIARNSPFLAFLHIWWFFNNVKRLESNIWRNLFHGAI